MPDVFTKRKRSAVMSRIRSRGNKDTEIALAKLLRAAGVTGWRRQAKVRIAVQSPESKVQCPRASVRPDFIFPKHKVAVFVDGCFWHACRWHCTYAKAVRTDSRQAAKARSRRLKPDDRGLRTEDSGPRTGRAFWLAKLTGNMARDRYVTRQLRRQGWRVVRVWEHELKEGRLAVGRIRRVLTARG